VLTHHPEDATPAGGVTFLNCGPAEAARIGLAAADGKNVQPKPRKSARRLANASSSGRSLSTVARRLAYDGYMTYFPGADRLRYWQRPHSPIGVTDVAAVLYESQGG
jgi:hypothetical protein